MHYNSIVTHLIKYGYSIFTVPMIDLHTDDIFSDFKRLLSEDAEFKKKWKFFFPELTKKPDHGLIPPKGEGHDQKWFLMFRKNLEQMLLEERLTAEEMMPYVDFFKQLNIVHDRLLHHAYEIAEEIDRQLPGYNVAKQIQFQSLVNTHAIRLVEYLYEEGAPATAPMASLHTDQSFLTMQFYQSHPGLVVRDYFGNEIRYNYEPGRVICFFGKKIVPVLGETLEPVDHWVDSEAGENRNSGIFFIHSPHPSIEMDKNPDIIV